jgi:hypothetical protein
MHCHICDKILGPDEIKFNRDHKEFDPCSECLQIISEVFGPDDDEVEIDRQLAYEFFMEGLNDNGSEPSTSTEDITGT